MSVGKTLIVAGMAALLLLLQAAPPAAKRPYTTWSDYGGAADSVQYSALNQINKDNVGQPRPLGGPSATPGRVFENLIVVGSQTGEMYGSAPCDLRAYDVVTGKVIWTFHTIPHPGESGYDTWPKDAWTYVGGVNTWREISIDEKRGIGYFPLGSPTHDSYGADRKGARQYIAFCASGTPQNNDPNSIVAVPGKVEAQGYYVFALPKPAPASKKK